MMLDVDEMTSIDIEDSYPLAPMQEGMLFHSLLSPGTGEYIQQLVCQLHEELNVPAFKEAWQQVMERHSVLRTSFHWEKLEAPLQRVHRNISVPFEEKDWRGLSKEHQEQRLEDYLCIDRERGFDINDVPLVRFALFRMGESDFSFIWTSHHALMDGRSRLILLREAFALYEAFCKGEHIDIPLPPTYRNYIDWLREQDFGKTEKFWKRMLEGFTVCTQLPVSHAVKNRSARKEVYGEEEIKLSTELTSGLQSLEGQHQLTLNTIVQGAWAILLSRYSGEKDVIFGATRACRYSTVSCAESMIGLFINTVPVRVPLSPEWKLLPWLRDLRSQWVTLRKYEHTPLIEIQRWGEMGQGKPLFETILVFEGYQLNSVLQAKGGNWKNRSFRLLERTNYPLAVTGYLDSSLFLKITYDRRRFEGEAINRMLGHLRTLLEGILDDPSRRIKDLQLLTDAERHQLLVEWNDTKADYPKERCIHKLFEAQVERTPEEIALIFGEQELSYRELNARSNRLAHYLKKCGVGPEVLVGICVERSLELVTGMLGILKAGGAYVPLDPLYPKERLAFMLEDAQVRVLLTQKRLVNRLPEHQINVVCLDVDLKKISEEPDENPVSGVSAENLAYVMYTSGSMGTPKGVLGHHLGTINRASWMWETWPFAANEKCAHTTSLNFVDSLWELFGSLLQGIPTVIVPDEIMKDAQKLLQTFIANSVTRIVLVPSLLRILLDTCVDFKEGLSGPKIWISSGEVLQPEICQRFRASLPHHTLLNLYGSTEIAGDATHYDTARMEDNLPSVPIGRPIANTKVYILDSDMQPVPIGVRGEIHIGGCGVARGYLNRPDLTAERFIPDPFSNEVGARLYKSGDLGCYLPDGNIEFLGRIDRQIKVRGFRVELGEIEAVLGQHPGVRQTVVIVHEESPAGKKLVAYLVAERGSALQINELRGFLGQKLPDYMIPSAYVILESLPLTPNGKVDRRALPPPDPGRPTLEERFASPRTQTEKTLTEIWEKTLGVRPIGIRDNFFELGGHSLMTVRLCAEIEKTFEKKLPLSTVFQAQTVEQLADVIQNKSQCGHGSSLVALQPNGTKPPFICVHTVGGNLFRYQTLARYLAPDQPFYGLQAWRRDRRRLQEAKVEDMAADYVEQIQRFQAEGPFYLGGFCLGGVIAFEMAQQLLVQGEEVALLALFDARVPGLPVQGRKTYFLHRNIFYAIYHLFQRLGFHVENLKLLSKQEKWDYVAKRAQNVRTRTSNRLSRLLKATDIGGDDREPKVVKDIKEIEEIIGRAYSKYVPSAYPGRIILFRANKRPPELDQDPLMGWSVLAAGGVETHEIPGWHTFILEEPGVRVLEKKLRICLEKAQKRAQDQRAYTAIKDETIHSVHN